MLYSDENNGNFKKNENHFKVKGELEINDLPPIEELKVSVSEEECTQIGNITSIVDLLGKCGNFFQMYKLFNYIPFNCQLLLIPSPR